jgi:hypothetical protein
VKAISYGICVRSSSEDAQETAVVRSSEALTLTAEHARHLVDVMTAAPGAAAEGRGVAVRTSF